MDAVRLGEDPFGKDFMTEVNTLIASNQSNFCRKWESLGANLGIDDVTMLSLKHKVRLGKINSDGTFQELWREWIAEKGDKATLKAFYDALVTTNIENVPEYIEAAFNTEVGRLISIKVHGDTYCIQKVVQAEPSDFVYEKIREALRTVPVTEPIPLFRQHLFPQMLPSYYVSRKLLLMPKVDTEVFFSMGAMNHVFVLRGINQNDLRTFTRYSNATDISSKQLAGITVRFIILEDDEHFTELKAKTEEPMHLFQFIDSSLYWEKSTDGFDIVQKYLMKEGINRREDEIKTMLANLSPPSAFCISDSPGMGKTLVLSSLCRSVYHDGGGDRPFTLFIVLEEFARELAFNVDTVSSAIKALTLYASHNELSKIILQDVLERQTWPIDLFLDGYDEILREKLDSIDSFISYMRRLKNIRMVITTRPHFQNRLQTLLKVGAISMQKLDDNDQVEFLTKFWTHERSATAGPILDKFSRHCLAQVQSVMTLEDNNIAEIPLQCMLLAEVFAQHAIRYSQLKTGGVIKLKINSLFELYRTIIHLKLKKALHHQRSRRNAGQKLAIKHFLNAHFYDSIKLIFPEWITRLSKHFDGNMETNSNKIFSVGLVEKSPYSSTPRFVHRTFAEFLVAQFLVKKMDKCNDCFELVFSTIFGELGISANEFRLRPTVYEMQHYVVGFFFDRKLDSVKSHDILNRRLLKSFSTMKFGGGNMCAAVILSCSQKLASFLELASELMIRHFDKNSEQRKTLQDKYFKYLPHIAVERTNDHNFIKHTLKLIEAEFTLDLNYHIYHPNELSKDVALFQFEYIDNYNYPWIPECSPLHVALFHGNYNIVLYLLKEYGSQVYNLKYLVHVCVRESAKNNEAVIEDKILILHYIIDIARKSKANWLEEKFEETDCSPLLQNQVHFKLLQKLVQLGADVNAVSQKSGTILHTINNTNSYEAIITWACSHGFRLINYRDADGLNILQRAISKFGVLTLETLTAFYNAGANFNNMDHNGSSALSLAIRTGDLKFISEMIDFGADVTQQTNEKFNVAHVVINYAKTFLWASNKVIGILEVLFLKGFNNIDQQNSFCLSPLHMAIQLHNLDEKLLDFFREKGANFNSEDNEGNSVYFHAIKLRKKWQILDQLKQCGANICHKNSKGQNALHIAALYNNELFYIYLLKEKNHSMLINMSIGQDLDKNLPAHLLFSNTVGNKNSEWLRGALCSEFALAFENNCGNIPFIQWLKNNIFSVNTVIQYQDHLQVSPEVASKALKVLIENRNLMQHFCGMRNEQTITFAQFIKFLVGRKAKYERSDGSVVKLEQLIDQLNFFNDLQIDTKILPRQLKILSSNIKTVTLKNVFMHTKVELEQLLILLLELEKFEEFVQVCNILTNRYLENSSAQEQTQIQQFSNENIDSIPWIIESSVFHFTASRGDYDATKRLIDEHKEQVRNAKYIFHACVRDSVHLNDLAVKGIVKILNMLYKENSDWLEERLVGRTPLLERGVHFKLLSCLVTLGANINAKTPNGESILSLTNHGVSYTKLVKWAISNGFKEINFRDPVSLATPLLYSIYLDGSLTADDLKFFYEAGADFNSKDVDEDSVLFYALKTKDINFVERVLRYDVDVNYKTSTCFNAMHLAVGRMYKKDQTTLLQTLKLLISKGFTGINEKFKIGSTTPLVGLMSVLTISDELFDCFKENGALIDEAVLFTAISSNQSLRIIQRILQVEININHQDLDENNLAHLIFSSKLELGDAILIFKQVLSKGFNTSRINHANSRGMRPIDYVLMRNTFKDQDLLHVLNCFYNHGLKFNSLTVSNGDSILFIAVKFNHSVQVISKLIEYGADVYHKNSAKQNIIHIAAQFSNASVMEFLLDKYKHLNINCTDSFGNSVLHFLFNKNAKNNRQILELLLKRGCTFGVRNDDGYYPIISWIMFGYDFVQTVVETSHLLPFNCDIASCALTALLGQGDLLDTYFQDEPTENRNCALASFINTLIEKGGKLLMRDGTNISWDKLPSDELAKIKSLLCRDIESSHKTNDASIEGSIQALCNTRDFDLIIEICSILRPTMIFYMVNELHTLISSAYLEAVRKDIIVKEKAIVWWWVGIKKHINESFLSGLNAAHLVVQQGHYFDSNVILRMLELLISWCFNVINKVADDELTPLHYAVQMKGVSLCVVDFFFKNLADFNATDSNGATVLHHAIAWQQEISIFLKLVNCGADTSRRDSNKRSLLHYAASYGNYVILEYLLDTMHPNTLDTFGNAPLHSMFRKDNVNYVPVINLLLQKGAMLTIENSDYRVPFLEWIQKGKINLASLVLLYAMDIIQINSNVASKALNLLICRHDLLKFYLSDDNVQILIAFIHMMIKKGGTVLLIDHYAGYSFQWKSLSDKTLQSIDKMVTQKISLEFAEESPLLKHQSRISISESSFSVEILLTMLLQGRFYNTFLDLCKILTPFCSNSRGIIITLEDVQAKVSLSCIPNCSLLHKVVSFGSFKQAEHLINGNEETLSTEKYLMHACVLQSDENDMKTILGKKQILEMLIKINSSWFGEELDGSTPLLVPYVHLKLQQHLVQLGANINTYSAVHGTILHRVTNSSILSDMLKWTSKSNFTLINHKNQGGQTCLHDAIKKFGSLEDEVLRLFIRAGADINAVDDYGISVLFSAFYKSNSIHFIRQIILHGANINHTCHDGTHAAHLLANLVKTYNSNVDQIVDKFNLLFASGFRLINELDLDDGGNTSLHLVVYYFREKYEAFLNVFHKNGADFNAKSKSGIPILFYAIDNKHCLEFLDTLLQFGVDVNCESSKKYNAAHKAIRNTIEQEYPSERLKNILEILIRNGFRKLSGPNETGSTPLHFLVHLKNVDNELVDWFYRNDADFSMVDSDGFTALFEAIQNPNCPHSLIEKLLECGANPNHKTIDKWNAAHVAIVFRDKNDSSNNKLLSLLQLLMQNGFEHLNEAEETGTTPLHLMVQQDSEDLNLLEFFHENGADFNAVDDRQFSVLCQSVLSLCSYEFFCKCIDYGSNVNYSDQKNISVAHLILKNAIRKAFDCNQALKYLKFLVSKGFRRLGEVESEGRTLVQYALEIENLDEKLLDFLYEHGANFDHVDNSGKYALFDLFEGTLFTVGMLEKMLDYGADINFETTSGVNAAHIAIFYTIKRKISQIQLQSVLRLLFVKGFSKINNTNYQKVTPLHSLMALKDLDVNILEIMFRNGADFSVRDILGETVILWAIRYGQNASIISLLIKYGCDPLVCNLRNNNALMFASSCANSSALELLINLFPDINAVDDDGDTPLHDVFSRDDRDYKDLITILVQKGSKLDVQNKKGYIPLVRWIKECKNPLPTIVSLKDMIPITSHIASKTLTAIIEEEAFLSKHLSNESPEELKSAFTIFFSHLVSHGAKLLMKNELAICWDQVSSEKLGILSHFISFPVLDHIAKGFNISTIVDKEFINLVRKRSISIEALLNSMLFLKEHDTFVSICTAINVLIC